MSVITKEIDLSGRKLVLETGRLAPKANGSVLARWGDTVVLAVATMGEPLEGAGFFPLRVDYIERLYAGGIIKGSRFVKRERAPRDEIVLAGRMIDRSIRPLFPKEILNEIQVIAIPLSVDKGSDPDLLALIAASAALHISDIPWKGPLGATRVGRRKGTEELIVNPPVSEFDGADLNLIVAGTESRVVMIEAGAHQIPEQVMFEAAELAHRELRQVVDLIEDFRREAGKEKLTLIAEVAPDAAKEAARKEIGDLVEETFIPEVFASGKFDYDAADEFKETLYVKFEGRLTKSEMDKVFEALVKESIRRAILERGQRLDGRALDETRSLEADVGLLPRTHGSGFFKRGETHVLTVTTLGSTSLEQLIEGMFGESTKRYIHHYYFPPFSTGEVGRIGSPRRREIGHGALAEKALFPVVPSEEEFPYALRLVSEVLSSNGSSSMASTCGSSLSLMDAGVPITGHVAGIAMGLVVGEDGAYKILTDIAGYEDSYGDMDFKVAGTAQGITAVQMDVKFEGLTLEMVSETFSRALESRLKILDVMNAAIEKPRALLSEYAPRVIQVKIDPAKIGQVIGSGGKVIRSIIEETGAAIDVQDDGTVLISSIDEDGGRKAKEIVENLVKDVNIGEVYEGTVTRIEDFGAFVEVLPGKDGLVRVGELAHRFVNHPTDVVKLGDKVKVKVIEIDRQGRINLSKKVLEEAPQGSRPRPPSVSGGYRPRRGPAGRNSDRRPSSRSASRSSYRGPLSQGPKRRGYSK